MAKRQTPSLTSAARPICAGRLERLLLPSPKHPKRLQLAGRVRRIVYRLTGSDFESLLLQFDLLQEIYGPKALERMHLGAPAFIRYLGGNPYPRITVTNKPSQREADWAYGPFASRAAAERFAEEALKLFLLRRCVDELDPNPAHPGCVYSEMKMCLAPCYQGCTDERYGEESDAVRDFMATRGESKLVTLRTERDAASAELEFEKAAALHAQAQKVEAVRALALGIVAAVEQSCGRCDLATTCGGANCAFGARQVRRSFFTRVEFAGRSCSQRWACAFRTSNPGRVRCSRSRWRWSRFRSRRGSGNREEGS